MVLRLGAMRVSLLACLLLPVGAAAESRAEARGWLQLDLDQRAYRERVAPLTLPEQRRLETTERQQRNDLRALEQQERRRVDSDSRRQRLNPQVYAVPREDAFARQRQTIERKRLEIRTQQQGLPFGRRPAMQRRAAPTPVIE